MELYTDYTRVSQPFVTYSVALNHNENIEDKSEVFDSDRQTNWCMQLVHLTKREV